MQTEKRTLRGFNSDHNEQVIPQGDYTLMQNMRIGVSDTNNLGIASSVKGNALVDYIKQLDPSIINYSLPSGINTVIGCHEDKPNSKIYIFVHNSNGFNLVLEYNILTGLTLELLKDVPATPVLDFNINKYINHIDVYNRNLSWTDGNSEPKNFNLQNFEDGKYPNVIKEEHITAMTPQPLYPPYNISIYSDASETTNSFYGRTYQFRYSWFYVDEQESAMSPASTLVFASNKSDNACSFVIKTGNKLVKKLFIYGRFGNTGNWFLVEKIDKEVLGIFDNSQYQYVFRNNGLYSFTDTRFASQNFFRVPIKADTQSIIDGDRKTYGTYTEDYDNVDITGEIIIDGYKTESQINTGAYDFIYKEVVVSKGLKLGGAYNIGMVYYDKFGRHGGVNTSESLKLAIPYPTNNEDRTPILVLNISSLAPSWAKRCAIVRTMNLHADKYIQFFPKAITYTDDSGGASTFTAGTRMQIDTSNITSYYSANGGIVSYDYAKGDRIRFIRKHVPAGAVAVTQYDFDILQYDSSNGMLAIDNKLGVDLSSNPSIFTFEIYTPSAVKEQSIYYEVDMFFDISSEGYHQGNYQIQTGSQPALFILDTSDTYYRLLKDGDSVITTIEANAPSYLYQSVGSDIGRGNVVSKELKQTKRKYSITYSERAILDTNINGFNQFYDDSFERYTEAFGEIKRTYYENNQLIVFMRKKVGYAMVNQKVITDNTGQELTVPSDIVLSKPLQLYSEEFGIWDNPESFAVYGHAKYFVDIYRGAVLRLSRDGITVISDYNAHAYWDNKSKAIFSAPNEFTILKIFGVFDKSSKEYIVSIVFSDDETTSQTFAFSETLNRWTSYYSYLPQNTCSHGNTFVSFKDGKMYLHNVDGQNNKFYGVFSPSMVNVVFNAMGDVEKTALMLSLNSNASWDAEITNSRQQLSRLIKGLIPLGDFDQIDNEYVAGLLKDENTPYVDVPLIDGDDMRGVWTKIALSNDNEDNYADRQVELYSIALGYIPANFTLSQ